MYASLSELRAEGFTVAMMQDRRALTLIERASRVVEMHTRRFFEPRAMTFTLSGEGGPVQRLRDPIIALGPVGLEDSTLDAASFKAYNRHIAEGLMNPDDRADPRIEFSNFVRLWPRVADGSLGRGARDLFWGGVRNVEISGVFGYTEHDPDSLVGITPPLITQATLMIVAREQAKIGDTEARQELDQGPVKEIRTRDQSISYGTSRRELAGDATSGVGDMTGDTAIDDILGQYLAPMFVGSC